MCNNETVMKITIRMRKENVYDIYLNDTWMCSKGHYENVLDEVRNIIKQIDDAESQK